MTYLGTGETPVAVEEEQVGLFMTGRDDGVGVGPVRDALLVENVLPGVPRPEAVEAVTKQIPQMVEGVPVPVVLAVVVFLVEVRSVLRHSVVVVHPSPLRV